LKKQILIIFAGVRGYLDNLQLSQITKFEHALYNFVDTNLIYKPYILDLDENLDEDVLNNLFSTFFSTYN